MATPDSPRFDLQPHRRPRPATKGLRRGILITEVVAVVLIDVVWEVWYRRRLLRWRVHGATNKWKHDLFRRYVVPRRDHPG